MKLIEEPEWVIPGELRMYPVCSKCGCDKLYIQKPGMMVRLTKCPNCNHKLNWSNKS